MPTTHNRVLLLYTPAGGGHRAAANAVAESVAAADPGADIEVRDVLELAPRWFKYDRAWSLIQTEFRRGWDWVFDHTDRDEAAVIDELRLPLHRAIFGRLEAYLDGTSGERGAGRFTHVVTTHYLPAISVSRLKRKGRLSARALTTVTDHSTHRAWVTPGIDAYCVADPDVAAAMRRRNVGAPVYATGIPIARTAARPIVPIATRPLVPRVLVLLSGVEESDARDTIDAMAPLARARRVAARIVCGASDEVFEHATSALAGTTARIVRRIDGLLDVFDETDVVVTKSGGLVTSECLSRGRPMILPYRAPGQERGNRDYAVTTGAAVRARVSEIGAVIEGLASEPGRLETMSARGRAASHPGAADEVASLLLEGRDQQEGLLAA